MDRQILAGISSIVLIVLIVAWNVGDRAPEADFTTQTLGGNAFQTAIANGAPLIETNDALSVALQVNGDSLPDFSSLSLRNNVIRFTANDIASTASGINIELLGSENARGAVFTVQHSISSDGGFDANAPLVASRNQYGVWYTYVSGEQLTTLRNNFGPGWYTFTASATRGSETTETLRTSFFIA